MECTQHCSKIVYIFENVQSGCAIGIILFLLLAYIFSFFSKICGDSASAHSACIVVLRSIVVVAYVVLVVVVLVNAALMVAAVFCGCSASTFVLRGFLDGSLAFIQVCVSLF